MLTVSRPPSIRSSVASWRASWGGHISPQRMAARRRMALICGAIAAPKAIESIPSV